MHADGSEELFAETEGTQAPVNGFVTITTRPTTEPQSNQLYKWILRWTDRSDEIHVIETFTYLHRCGEASPHRCR